MRSAVWTLVAVLAMSHLASADDAPPTPAKPLPTPMPASPMPAAPPPPATVMRPKTAAPSSFEGRYRSAASPVEIQVTRLFGDAYQLAGSDGLEGVGFVDGGTYRGVFRNAAAGASGVHAIELADLRKLSVRTSNTSPRSGEVLETWSRLSGSSKDLPPPPPSKPVVVMPPPEKADAPPPTSAPSVGVEGSYRSMGTDAEIRIRHLSGETYDLVASDGCEGIGIVDRGVYRGVFHYNAPRDSSRRGVTGVHTIDLTALKELHVQASYTSNMSGEWTEVWKPIEGSPPPRTPPPVSSPQSYVYVDELPEAITKVAPEYPPAARQAGVDGTVMLSANVREDGTVGDVHVVNSIPLLDAAAIAAVRQWRFKPATAKGVAVATWVVVPLKFSLH